MERIIRLVLRALQLLWTLLLTALIGNAIANDVNAPGTARAAINFTMFVIVVSWLASLYGLACELFSSAFRAVVALPLDAASTLFSFIAAVVLSAKLGAVNCAAVDPDDKPGDYIAFGSLDTQKRCREIQAGAVFFWFLLVCYAASLVFTFKEARGGLRGGSILSSRPSMAQVGV